MVFVVDSDPHQIQGVHYPACQLLSFSCELPTTGMLPALSMQHPKLKGERTDTEQIQNVPYILCKLPCTSLKLKYVGQLLVNEQEATKACP